MASVLQQQLAIIAAKSTHQLDLKAQKVQHSKSLLFESREAASQTFDTVYQICIEGFEELCHLDSRFVPFRRNIFSDYSKNEDRIQMTVKENQELSAVIEQFLGLLSARLLLRPAIKAAEWLIRRFRVHEYNTEALLLTFLPYHTSQIFPTLLSILPQQLPAIFKFLHPYVTSLQCPPRRAIVAAASKDGAFLSAITEYTLKVSRLKYHSAILLGFWTSTFAQATDAMADLARSGREAIRRQKEEDMILRVLPILKAALEVENVPELYLGSCMVMMILANKAALGDKILNSLMEAVVYGWTDETFEDGMKCLAMLAQEKHHHSLPRAVAYQLWTRSNSISSFKRVANQCHVDALLSGASFAAVKRAKEKGETQPLNFLKFALKSGLISQRHSIAILESILPAIIESPGIEQIEGRQNMRNLIHDCSDHNEFKSLFRIAASNTGIHWQDLDSQLALFLTSEDVDQTLAVDAESMNLDDEIKSEDEPQFTLATLPSLPPDFSFLSPRADNEFGQYATEFQSTLARREKLFAFLNFPSLQRDHCTETAHFFSFLARAWTSDLPVSVRVKALKIAESQAQSFEHDSTNAVDMQALFPYIIAALSDPARVIRAAAAAACASFSRLFDIETTESTTKDIFVWGKSTIYSDQSSVLEWLQSTDSHRLFSKLIVPNLQDCILDDHRIVQVLRETVNASTSDAGKTQKEFKAKSRESLCGFFATHLVASPISAVKLCLLQLWSGIGKVGKSTRLRILLPYWRDSLQSLTSVDILSNKAIVKAIISSITHRSKEELELLRSVADGTSPSIEGASDMAFERIKQLWNKLEEQSQVLTVDWLLGLVLESRFSSDIQASASDTMQDISMPTGVLVHLVESVTDISQSQEQNRAQKRQRTSRSAETSNSNGVDSEQVQTALRRITFVLELVDGSRPEKHPHLLRSLFRLMSELFHYRHLTGSELVYLHSLLIGCLNSVIDGVKTAPEKKVDRSFIRADLIVECVRTTTSTQIHQAGLLLISSLASWAPDIVLHSVMPLFTFMSSTIFKLNDDYSAHVAEQTVSQVVPPLAAALKKRGKDWIVGAADLLISFTAAFEHIPMQRRIPLFRHLARTLGAEVSLFAIVAMLIERYQGDPKVVQFVSDLMDAFSVLIQLRSMQKYLDLVFDALKTKRGLSDVILSFEDKTELEAKTSISSLLGGLAQMIRNASLRRKTLKVLNDGGEEADDLRHIYSKLLERTMELTSQSISDEEVLRSANEVLTALLSFMPTEDFIHSSANLMQSGSNDIRQRVFTSLEQRIATAKQSDPSIRKVFVNVIPNCTIFISESQPAVVRYAAISCIDQINDSFGKTDPTAIMIAAQQVSGAAALGSDDLGLRTISLLCLSGMVETLQEEFIPILPPVMDKALAYLEETIRGQPPDESLQAAVYGFVCAVLDNIPWVLPASQVDRLLKISAASADYNKPTSESVKKFSTPMAKTVAAYDCLKALDRSWQDGATVSTNAATFYIHMLQEVVTYHTKATINKNAQLLFSILLKAFDLRRTLTDSRDNDANGEKLEVLLNLVDKVALDVVFKLNDATFRPFFGRLAEWATDGLGKNDYSGTISRCISLYSFALSLFEQLRSLVTAYCSFLLENVIKLLQSLDRARAEELQLFDLVLQSLSSSFRHDQDGFWQSPAHFDLVVEPLVSQLQKSKDMAAASHSHLVSAITHLTVASGSVHHHKTVNGMAMTLMRHQDATVRLAAVQCERAITENLGLDWLALLPEMLPFISELQEDDDEAVERETWRWIKQIEDVTGESLEGMLQ